MYQFKDQLNEGQFFWWRKRLIKNRNWALLSQASKAVFPVIACHCNPKGLAFPSERTIAILGGVSEKIARKGTNGLDGFPDFKVGRYINKKGARAKRYHIKLPSRNVKGQSFPFFRFVMDSGMWCHLKPSAKALYPVMRCFGYFDFDTYAEIEGLDDTDPMEFNEIYGTRKYDICEAEKGILAEYAGINRRSINEAINSLRHEHLVEQVDGKSCKIFLRPTHYYHREYLNQKVRQAYKHDID